MASITADHMQLASLLGDPSSNAVPMALLPDEMLLEIFSHLNLQSLAKCRLIARKFSMLDSNELELKQVLQYMVPFGKEEWETYFGKVGEEPPLPPLKVLKEIYKTYILVLLPKTLNGKPLTFNLFRTLAEKRHGNRGIIDIYPRVIITQFGNVANGFSRWVLFPKNILEGSRGVPFNRQKELVTEYSAKKEADYEMTHMLEAVVSLISRDVQLNERLFVNDFTNCQEIVNTNEGEFPITVGFGSFLVVIAIYDSTMHSVAAVRKH